MSKTDRSDNKAGNPYASPKPDVPADVQDAIRTLIKWSGDDPDREGLLDTPKRVARAWSEYCQGYSEDPSTHLSRTFEEVGGYDEVVLLKDIPFQSHCEHHMAPIIGKAAIAYLPRTAVLVYPSWPVCCTAMRAACKYRSGLLLKSPIASGTIWSRRVLPW